MSSTQEVKRRRAPIVPGILLILLGVWLLGRQLNLPLFVGDVLWPWLLIAAGIVIWARYIFLPPRSSDDLFWATGTLLAGAFLLVWRNGFFLSNLEGWGQLWPMVPLIMGISALVEWLFDMRKWFTLVFAVGANAVGWIGLGYTTGSIDSMTAWRLAQYWPMLIVIAGLGVLIHALLGKRADR